MAVDKKTVFFSNLVNIVQRGRSLLAFCSVCERHIDGATVGASKRVRWKCRYCEFVFEELKEAAEKHNTSYDLHSGVEEHSVENWVRAWTLCDVDVKVAWE